MNKVILSALVATSLLLAGCETGGTKQTVGGLTGAVAGGLLGAQIGDGRGQIAAAAIGTLLGAMAGSEIGKSLDKADLAYANQSLNQAHNTPMGQTINWNNPQSGHAGSYTPVNDGYSNTGSYCRQYKQTVTIDGRQETAYGTACKNPNGTWQVTN
ncbi:MAG: RT0821/Lpp0805 family surface protein [Pseudomonadota bacterium]